MPCSQHNAETIQDVERCTTVLKDLEPRWSGARRSRVIIENLLLEHRRRQAPPDDGRSGDQWQENPSGENAAGGNGNKRTFSSIYDADRGGNNALEEGLFWNQFVVPEMVCFNGFDLSGYSSRDEL